MNQLLFKNKKGGVFWNTLAVLSIHAVPKSHSEADAFWSWCLLLPLSLVFLTFLAVPKIATTVSIIIISSGVII